MVNSGPLWDSSSVGLRVVVGGRNLHFEKNLV